jgi:hypothetical protein
VGILVGVGLRSCVSARLKVIDKAEAMRMTAMTLCITSCACRKSLVLHLHAQRGKKDNCQLMSDN